MKRIASIFLLVCMCLLVSVMFMACTGEENNEQTTKAETTDNATDTTVATDTADTTATTETTQEEQTAESQADTEVSSGEEEETQEHTYQTDIIYGVDPVRGSMYTYHFDEKGRLSEIWSADDILEWGYHYFQPAYSFVYGEDGRLTRFAFSENVYHIAYNNDGTPYFSDASESMYTSASLQTLILHENGSIKQIAFDIGGEVQTITFDEKGRITSVAWAGDSDSGEYGSSYENNRQVITLTEDGQLYDAEIIIEYNEDGKPLKQSTRMGQNTEINLEWSYHEKVLVSVVDHDDAENITLTYDDNGCLVRKETKRDGVLTEYVVYTYDQNGLRLTEMQYDAEDNYQEGYTYSYTQGNLETITRETIEGERYVRVYDAKGNMLSETIYSEWEGDSEGERVYQEDYRELN